MIRVVVVDSHEPVRERLRRILAPRHGFEIVAECADGAEALEVVRRLWPDLVLLDVRAQELDGGEAARELRALNDPPAVLALTTYDDDDVLLAGALAAGAAGFVLKDAPGSDVHRAARAVVDGGGWIDPTIAGRVIDTYRSSALPRARTAARVAQLAQREREVLELLGRGATNREIAETLDIDEGAVATNVDNLLTKLHLRDRVAAVVFAFEHGVVAPGMR